MGENLISTGKTVSGKEVFALELINSRGTKVKLYNYGAIISSFVIKNQDGEDQDIILGFDNIDGYLNTEYLNNYPYLGAVIGRYSNRIKNGQFSINGRDYKMDQSLHGGKNGFDKKVWDVLPTIDPSVTLQYVSQDGEENFPGKLTVQITFKLTDEDELILDYHAFTDAPTAINLTHHPYFNLAKNLGNIGSHVHRMPASNYLMQDQDYVVNGLVSSVKDTIHDFLTAKPIAKDWDPSEGYDQSYILDKPYGELGIASTTFDKSSGLTLEIYTTEPVAHFYTSKYLNVTHGKGGKDYHPFDAFCVETQHAPNSINVPEFPTTILNPGERYMQTTIFKVISSS